MTTIDRTFAREALIAAGLTEASPIADIIDTLVEAVSEARPEWDDDRVNERADALAFAIAT